MTIQPNALGRVLRYVIDGIRFGVRDNESKARNMFGPSLRGMADSGNYEPVDTERAYKLAMCTPWVYADISLIAKRIAAETMIVRRRVGEELVDIANHPFERLWAQPGGTYTGGLAAQYIIWWYCLRGNGYLFVATDGPGRGEPRELWPLIASQVQPVPKTLRKSRLTGKPIIDYAYHLEQYGQPIMLPGENVVHFRTPNPTDYWRGLSPLVAALTGIELDAAARRWQRDWYREDNAVPKAFVGLAAGMSDSDFDRMVDDIRQSILAGERLLFGRTGDMKIESIQQTLEQMQHLESREFTQKEIDAIYNVPTGILSGGMSGDARQAMDIAFNRNCIQPLLKYMAQELTMRVAPYYGEDIVIVASDVVSQDKALQVQEYQTYSMDRTINENRKELGLGQWEIDPKQEELLGMDVQVFANIPTRVLTLLGRATSSQMAEAFQPGTAGNLPGSQSPEMATNALAEKAAELGFHTELKRWEKVAVGELRAGRAPADREFTTDIIPDGLRDVIKVALEFAETESDVREVFVLPFVKAVRETSDGTRDPNGAAKDEDETRLIRLLRTSLRKQEDRILEALGDPPDLNRLNDMELWDREQREVIGALRPHLERMALAGAQTEIDLLPVGVDWGQVAEDAIDWASQYATDWGRDLGQRTFNVLRRKIAQHLETPGQTIGQLRSQLEPIFGTTRATLISTTEVTRAYAMGAKIAAERVRQQGQQLTPIWRTNRDEKVCFPAWTMVETDGGPLPIQNVRPGMRVKTRRGYYPVGATVSRFYSGGMVQVDASCHSVVATAQHPFCEAEKGWLQGDKLAVGDRVQSVDGKALDVRRVLIYDTLSYTPIRVFNLEINGPAEFYANGMLVHNCSICGPNDGKPQDEWENVEWPPAHPRCILPDNYVAFFGDVQALAESEYDGPIVKITLSTADELKITPNHPVMTPRGARTARGLAVGDTVLWSHVAARRSAKDLIETAEAIPFKDSVLVENEDYHGDGKHIANSVISRLSPQLKADPTVFEDLVGVRRIHAIDRDWYTGPVYDFQSDGTGTYIASGVVVSNCRCFVTHRWDVATGVPSWREDMTNEELAAWAREQAGLNPTISPDEEEMVRDYKGNAYSDINDALRLGGYSYDEREALLEQVVARTQLDESITVYRGASFEVFEDYDDLTGAIIDDQAYVSTSLSRDIASGFGEDLILEIRLPKGSHALFMDPWGSGYTERELELLLQKGARFKVLQDTGASDDERYILMELLS